MNFPITIDSVGYDKVDDLIREITRRAEDFVLPGRASTHPGGYFDRFRTDPGAAAALNEACESIVRSHDNGDAVALAVAITPSGASRTWVEAVLALSRIDVPDSRHYGSGPEIRRRALANLAYGIGQLAPELFPKYRRELSVIGAWYEATLNAIKHGNDEELLELAEAWGKSEVIDPRHTEIAASWLRRRPDLLVRFAQAIAPANLEARKNLLVPRRSRPRDAAHPRRVRAPVAARQPSGDPARLP
jgi:hypothetical protein